MGRAVEQCWQAREGEEMGNGRDEITQRFYACANPALRPGARADTGISGPVRRRSYTWRFGLRDFRQGFLLPGFPVFERARWYAAQVAAKQSG
jgi:hypothetical protein